MASAASLDPGAFSVAELQSMLAAAKAELLRRMSGGSVQQGSSAGQSFSMDKMSEDALIRMINTISAALGYCQPENRVAPNFSGRRPAYFGPAVVSPSRIEPNVTSWSDLIALSTTGYPNGTIKIFVEAATGQTITARLLPSALATDPDAGIYRPLDYADPGNARVWFQASS